MKNIFLILITIVIYGCKQPELKSGEFEIEWAENKYACVDDYIVKDEAYRFKSLSSGVEYIVPELRVNSIKIGCTYYKQE